MFLRLKDSFHITLLAGSKVIENRYTSVYFLNILFLLITESFPWTLIPTKRVTNCDKHKHNTVSSLFLLIN